MFEKPIPPGFSILGPARNMQSSRWLVSQRSRVVVDRGTGRPVGKIEQLPAPRGARVIWNYRGRCHHHGPLEVQRTKEEALEAFIDHLEGLPCPPSESS